MIHLMGEMGLLVVCISKIGILVLDPECLFLMSIEAVFAFAHIVSWLLTESLEYSRHLPHICE